MAEVRFHNDEDSRRDLAVEMMVRHVGDALDRRTADMYRADIEYMEYALLAFADEWAAKDLGRVDG